MKRFILLSACFLFAACDTKVNPGDLSGEGLRVDGDRLAVDDDFVKAQGCSDGDTLRKTTSGWGCVSAEDTDTLRRLSCAAGAVPKWDGSAWTCDVDQVSGGLSGVTAGAGLAGGGQTGDVSLSVDFGGTGQAETVARSDHTQAWDTITSVPTGFADGVDNDALENLSCSSGEIPQRDAAGTAWECATVGAGSSPWVANGANISFSAGNVGIGPRAPTEKLHVSEAGSDLFTVSNAGVVSAPSQSAVHAFSAGQTTVTDGSTPSVVTYTAESFDNQNEFDPATGRFTATSPGVYLVVAGLNAFGIDDQPNDNNGLYLQLFINGSAGGAGHRAYSNDILNGHQIPNHTITTVVQLAAGDFIDMRVSTLNPEAVFSLDSPRMSVVKLL